MDEPFVELLAPVPLEHLRSGLEEVLDHEPMLAFGSMNWELFKQRLDCMRAGHSVRVWIYASENEGQPVPLSATWTARYIGCVDSKGGTHPDGLLYRPPTTFKYAGDNVGEWAIFWHVVDLRELVPSEYVPIDRMTGYGQRVRFGPAFVPHGPILIEPIR